MRRATSALASASSEATGRADRCGDPLRLGQRDQMGRDDVVEGLDYAGASEVLGGHDGRRRSAFLERISVSGPRLLLNTTAWPVPAASHAMELPMFPAPMVPMVVMHRSVATFR